MVRAQDGAAGYLEITILAMAGRQSPSRQLNCRRSEAFGPLNEAK
jgi:hypothetical protein